jgi:hypothetical protein
LSIAVPLALAGVGLLLVFFVQGVAWGWYFIPGASLHRLGKPDRHLAVRAAG